MKPFCGLFDAIRHDTPNARKLRKFSKSPQAILHITPAGSAGKPRRGAVAERLAALIFAIAGVSALAAIIAGSGNPSPAPLRIAIANDAAGMIVAYAAEKSGGAETSKAAAQNVSFLRLVDCCGARAEFALEADRFDMAVLCPDAAEAFLKNSSSFAIAGEIIRNANVLVSRTGAVPVYVGYAAGRALQAESAAATLGGDINLIPMAAAALPYALEKGAADAIVLDVLTAFATYENPKRSEYLLTPLPSGRATSVLVVNKGIVGTEPYNNFLDAYNECVDSMGGETLADILKNREKINNGREKAMLWQELGTAFIKIPKNGRMPLNYRRP